MNLSMLKDEVLAAELKSRGWTCEKTADGSWESPSAFSKRLGFNQNWLSRLISRGQVPPGLELHRTRGGKGSVVAVRASAQTEQWIRARER